jgi:chloride channel protein, CIC family
VPESGRWKSSAGDDAGLFRLLIICGIAGLATALGVRLFKLAIQAAEWLAFGWNAGSWLDAPPLLVLTVPVVGGAVVGLLLHFARIPEEPGHGVEEVIEAVALGTKVYPKRRTPLKAGIAALSLGAGASLGPEDPAVEIGGSIGELVGERSGLGRHGIQTVVAAGAAAGLSAAFHAPAAAVLFAVEVFALKLLSRTTFVVTLAVGVAFLATTVLAPGVEPALEQHSSSTLWELPLAMGLGLLGGVLSATQIRLMFWLDKAFYDWRMPPRWLKPAMGGLALGLTGLFLPELLGVGYETLERVVAGDLPVWPLLLALMAGKLVLMAVSFGSGFLGGFFAPTLFIGAMMGGAYGLAATALFPALGLEPAMFTLVGMAALLAGSVRAPLAVTLLVPALSGSYGLVPVLLVAALVGARTSRFLEADSLYTYGIVHPVDGAEPRTRDAGADPHPDVRQDPVRRTPP